MWINRSTKPTGLAALEVSEPAIDTESVGAFSLDGWPFSTERCWRSPSHWDRLCPRALLNFSCLHCPSVWVLTLLTQCRGQELNHKEGWAPKNWCFQTVVLEKTPESPLHRKEVNPVHPNGNQPWIFIGRTVAEAEAEAPILWPHDWKNWLIGKDPDAGKNWRQEEKGTTEDEIVGWHHWLDGHEFALTSIVGDAQGGLQCCSPWGHKESDTT